MANMADYLLPEPPKPATKPPGQAYCGCGYVLGRVVMAPTRDGKRPRLQIAEGGALVESAGGICPQCGQRWSFYSSEAHSAMIRARREREANRKNCA